MERVSWVSVRAETIYRCTQLWLQMMSPEQDDSTCTPSNFLTEHPIDVGCKTLETLSKQVLSEQWGKKRTQNGHHRCWVMLPSSVCRGNWVCACNFQRSRLPFVGRVVVLDAAFHVLQLVQHRKHVDEFPEGQQVRLGDEVFSALGVTQTTDFSTETVDCCTLEERDDLGFCNWAAPYYSQGESLLNVGCKLPGSTWNSSAWWLPAPGPLLFSHRSPLCWAVHCTSPKGKRKNKPSASQSFCSLRYYYIRLVLRLTFTLIIDHSGDYGVLSCYKSGKQFHQFSVI